jgi:hypothetical protein
MSGANRAVISDRRNRWASYLNGVERLQAPVATRFAPILISGGPSDDPDVAWPATIYPNGFRNQVLMHCAMERSASWRDEVRRPTSVVHRCWPSADANEGVNAWPSERRLRLALTFNVLSLYRATVEVMGPYGRSVERDPHLTYEVARAAYQVGAASRALQVFARLSSEACPSIPIRLNAISRQIAHYARSGDDLDECERWVERAAGMLADLRPLRSTDFASGLAVSRVHRATALYASRRREATWVIETLREAKVVNDGVEPHADTELRQLELLQNDRLILEAAIKAFSATGGRVDPLGATTTAERLVDLDGWDPYTRLNVGDAYWILADDARALESYDVAVCMGTIVGAHAAHRGAVLLARTGRPLEARAWIARAVELDPAAAAVVLPDA